MDTVGTGCTFAALQWGNRVSLSRLFISGTPVYKEYLHGVKTAEYPIDGSTDGQSLVFRGLCGPGSYNCFPFHQWPLELLYRWGITISARSQRLTSVSLLRDCL